MHFSPKAGHYDIMTVNYKVLKTQVCSVQKINKKWKFKGVWGSRSVVEWQFVDGGWSQEVQVVRPYTCRGICKGGDFLQISESRWHWWNPLKRKWQFLILPSPQFYSGQPVIYNRIFQFSCIHSGRNWFSFVNHVFTLKFQHQCFQSQCSSGLFKNGVNHADKHGICTQLGKFVN